MTGSPTASGMIRVFRRISSPGRTHVSLWLIPGIVILLAAASCDRLSMSMTAFGGSTMGTDFSVKVYAKGDRSRQRTAGFQNGVQGVLDQVNAQMSTYLDDSEITRFNLQKTTDWFPVSPETASVTRRALDVARATGGAYDPTIQPLVELWGFGPGKSKGSAAIPPEEAIREALEHVGFDKIEVRLEPPALRKLDPGVTLDLSSIAKGHGVDRLASLASEFELTDSFIDIGGEVRTQGSRGDRPWRVGIERPLESNQREVFAAFELSDAGMATSGNYRQFFEADGKKYGHSLDARTGWPVSHALRSVTVVAPTCEEADAWATALMVLGPGEALRLADEKGIAAYLLVDDGNGDLEVKTSRHWKLTAIEPTPGQGTKP